MLKIRRYYGHDADSFNGFNNGYYVDSEPIEVKDHSHAMLLCHDVLAERWNLSLFTSEDLDVDDNGYTLTTSYNDGKGNELTRLEYIQAENTDELGYRYVFVNYEVCDE